MSVHVRWSERPVNAQKLLHKGNLKNEKNPELVVSKQNNEVADAQRGFSFF